MVYTVVSLAILLGSVLLFIIETDPKYRYEDVTNCAFVNGSVVDSCAPADSNCTCAVTESEKDIEAASTSYGFEIFFNIFFTLELGIRYFASPDRRGFIRQPLSVVDFLAVVPFYVDVIILIASGGGDGAHVLTLIKVLRLVRVFRASKFSVGAKFFALTFYRSRQALMDLLVLFMIAAIVFASVAYYAEKDNGCIEGEICSGFESIHASLWWTIVTMTTLGYGDQVPDTHPGKAIAVLCVLAGIVVVAFTVPSIVYEYEALWAEHRAKLFLNKKKREERDESGQSVLPAVIGDDGRIDVLEVPPSSMQTTAI